MIRDIFTRSYPPVAPQVGRVLEACPTCGAASAHGFPCSACRSLTSVSIEDITWVDRETAIVTWHFDHSNFPSTSIVTVEFEPADPSVGIMSGGFIASSDCPTALDDLVAEDASLRAADDGDDRDDAYDSWRDWREADSMSERGQW